MGSLANVNVRFGLDLKDFTRKMEQATRSLKKSGDQMKKVGKSLSTYVSAPLIAMGGVSTKIFADFELGMAKVAAISGAAGGEFSMLEENAKELGRTTQFTASQVAELQLNLSKLGFNPAAINVSTSAILDLALATGEDLAQSATVAASTLRGFGMDATQMGRVVNVMADSFSSTALDLEKFQTAMAVVAPVAKVAGASLEDTTAILGTLMNRGVDASSAGTALRNIFLDLSDKGLGWNQALEMITNSTNPLATAMQLFGKRGATVATIIANNRQEISGLTQDFIDSDGEARKMAGIMENTLSGSFKTLQSALEGAAIGIGEQLAPAIRKLAGFATRLVTLFSNLSDSQKKWIVGIGAAVAAIGPLLTAIGFFVGTLLPAMIAGFAAITSPVGLVIAALAALSAAVIYVADNWEAIKERISDLAWWRNALISMIQFFIQHNPFAHILDAYNFLVRQFGGNEIISPFDLLAGKLEGLKVEQKEFTHSFGSFPDAVRNAMDKAIAYFKGLTGAAEESKAAIEEIPMAVPGAGGGGSSTIDGAGGDGRGAMNQVPSSMFGETSDMGEEIDRWTEKMGIFSGAIDSAAQGMVGMFDIAVDGGVNAFQALSQAVGGFIKQLAKAVIKAAILAGIMALAGGGSIKFGDILTQALGLGNFDGARAMGGPVRSGRSYLVGENGPELFQAGSSGTIIPNHGLGGTGQMSLKAAISGDQLLLWLDRLNQRRSRIRGF